VKKICLVDVTGQDRPLPGLGMKARPTSADELTSDVNGAAWKVGFSECRGDQNRCDMLLFTLIVMRLVIIIRNLFDFV